MIAEINSIFLQQRPSERSRGVYERWFDVNSLVQYRTLQQEVSLKDN